MSLRFDNRVVLITGAGGGLGKVYALFFAERGASVVVNDLGVSRSGDGSSTNAADLVVNEIRRMGGKAVANYDSVDEGEKVVATALKTFGRLDIVINNAGILRDKSFTKMTDQDWDLVHLVHVRGAYKVTKAAWEVMRQQKFGRIIMTASAAGIYGNYGQANYGSAKLALYGLGSTLAREGEKYNVMCNTIAPLAASRMTEEVMPQEVLAALKPEYVAGFVGYLCHESSHENGGLYEIGAGFAAKLRWERSHGAVFKADATFTPSAVAARWEEVNDFSRPQYPGSITDTDWTTLLDQAKHLSSNRSAGGALRYDGRVAIITGSGGGLGRAYALMLASLGASVVVNDLGGSFTGTGANSRAADVVVEEIRKLGGKAVANYDSVEDGGRIVETAMKAFGRVDVLINNAGILRDKSFVKMTDEDWDLVYKVHLRGTFKVTKAAWDVMLKQKYGRIINTASAVGLYGNFGQANYSTAKAGILGLSNTLAIEGRKHNVLVNTIAPNAGTRMTATIFPPEMVEAFKPDYVAPLVGYLVHETCQDTGAVFEVGCGWAARVRWQRSGGHGFALSHAPTPEEVQSKWERIASFGADATYPTTTQESFQQVFENYTSWQESQQAGDGSEQEFEYGDREVILYALGVGATRKELDLVYENSDQFKTLPTFGVIPALMAVESVDLGSHVPAFNPMMLLHGEQYIKLLAPLPTAGKLVSRSRVLDVLDKGKGALVIIGVDTTDASTGKQIMYNESSLFIRGASGFGGPKDRQSSADAAAVARNEPPKRAPDAVVQEKTHEDQAALYRLSGDRNPLHIDPEMSAMGGFDVPILHGLCTFGIGAKHVFRTYCNSDPAAVRSVKARFVKHVFPGETLETRMWRDNNKVIFQVRVVERDEIAVAGAAVELVGAGMKAKL